MTKSLHAISSESIAHLLHGETTVKGAAFTVKSKKTQKDYTFKVSRGEYNGHFYTHVKVEVEYLKFKYLGWFRDGVLYYKGAAVDSPSAQAIAWIFRQVALKKFDIVNEQVEIMHLGSCLKCGRTLTDAKSIEIGLGPYCASAI